MKTVIFAGGRGTRLAEETDKRPKPMIEIGGRPLLWHIMKLYLHHGVSEFVICCGYKGEVIRNYFSNFLETTGDVTFDYRSGKREITVHRENNERWSITLVDTGLDTQTAGRLQAVQEYLQGEDFCLTYGDGVANVDVNALIAAHKAHGKVATVTAVRPEGRFGSIRMDGAKVTKFSEKKTGDEGWINGGFFVLKSDVFDYIPANAGSMMWEHEPLAALTDAGQLHAYKHYGFWQCVDTLREKQYLEDLYETSRAQWAVWDDAQLANAS